MPVTGISGTGVGAPLDPQMLIDTERIGREAHALIERLYPLCRSLTGDGVRKTLQTLQELVPLTIHEVPTGTAAYDWEVPLEWNVRDAYVLDGRGRRIIDFRANSLHLAGYSMPIDATVSREELIAHLFTDPDQPELIPYRHFYYRDGWGFCAPHRLLLELSEPEYRVVVDTRLEPGSLTYGELFLPGSEATEILFSTHTCHPSLCNDNLSGIAATVLLARELMDTSRRHGVRFVFAPATLGPLVWLSRNEDILSRIRGGLVVAGVGDRGAPTYLRTRHGSELIDRAMLHVLEHAAMGGASARDFAPIGYDQRQYCSPGFDLPIGCLMRTPSGEYPEYHTSADNPQFVTAASLGESWSLMRLAVDVLQADQTFVNLFPKGEPRLGPRGLFADAGRLGLFWTLNLSDGSHSLLDIAERSQLPFWRIREGARRLEASGLLKHVDQARDN